MKKFTFAIFKDTVSNVIGEYTVYAKNKDAAEKELLKYPFEGDFRLAMVS